VWDASILSEIVGDDLDVQRRLLEIFLVNVQAKVADISAAVQVGNLEAAASAAHSIKSAARTVGAWDLGALCESLQMAGRADNGPLCDALAPKVENAFIVVATAIRRKLEAQQTV
jgi:HPt (histidine-containing phosphotransfer) domain-containing protein